MRDGTLAEANDRLPLIKCNAKLSFPLSSTPLPSSFLTRSASCLFNPHNPIPPWGRASKLVGEINLETSVIKSSHTHFHGDVHGYSYISSSVKVSAFMSLLV